MADDRRTEAILHRHVRLSQAMWDVHAHADLHLAAPEALTAGVIHRIGDFAPPAGSVLVNI